MIAISRTTSEPVNPRQSVMEILSLMADLPFPMTPRIWNMDAVRAGVVGIEDAVRSWCDANADRVYVDSDAIRVEVIRRSDHRTLLVMRLDDPRKP